MTLQVYTASIPDLYVRFFGLGGPYNETVGKVRFERICAGCTGDERRLWADLHFKPRGTAGFKSKANRIDGTVYESGGGEGAGWRGRGGNLDAAAADAASAVGGCGAGGGEGFGFLENFGAVDAATKAVAAKWAAKAGVLAPALAGTQSSQWPSRVLMTLKGRYNVEVLANGTEPFWKAAKRRAKFPMAATVPIDLETESHLVWADLVRAIMAEDWKKAGIAKKRVEVAQRRLMKEIKEGRKVWEPRLFKRGQKEGLGVVNGLYTLKPFVRCHPPEPDPDWHEHITKSVFLDM